MGTCVIIVSEGRMKEMMDYYKGQKVTRNAPGVRFAANTGNAAITMYTSGKVLFQGAKAEEEAARWGGVAKPDVPKVVKTKGDKLPDGLASLSIIGSDETGTGDYFGPVTVCACYVKKEQIELVRELGVKDSKLLTDEVMRKIAPDLQATLIHSVLTLRNEKYNTIQGKGYSQGKIKALLHNQAIKHVLNKLNGEKPDAILIDQFAERGIYYNHIKAEPEIIRENVLFSTKAENMHVAVAAASIIARYAFLKEMDRLSDLAGFPLPKGAGPKVDEVAARILVKSGQSTLRSMTKWHFANTQKAIALVNRKKS